MACGRAHEGAVCTPVLFEIRVNGALDGFWEEVTRGMNMAVMDADSRSVTILRGVAKDQTALAGLLDSLFSLNVEVLSMDASRAE